MNDLANALIAVLVLVLCVTALFDLVRHPKVLVTTDRLRIPARSVPVLGAIKLLAAVSLVAGTGSIRLAEATGAFLVGYFAVAVLTHVRVKDGLRNTLPAFVMLAVSTLYLLATFAR